MARSFVFSLGSDAYNTVKKWSAGLQDLASRLSTSEEGITSLNDLTDVLPVENGGTGIESVSQGDLLYGSATDVISKLAKNTTATRYLSNTGTSNNPAWAQVNLANGVTGQLPIANIANITSGTYTPTLTAVANLDAQSAVVCPYIRIHDIVFVAGYVTVDPAAAVITSLRMSIPIASNFANTQDAGGTAAPSSGNADRAAAIFADPTNDAVYMDWIAATTTSHTMHFSFMYRVI